MREVGVLAEVSITEQVLREIFKFPKILGKLNMCKQCVPGSFLPAHTREPGNEAKAGPRLSREYTVFVFDDEFLYKRVRAGHERSEEKDLRLSLHFSERGYI